MPADLLLREVRLGGAVLDLRITGGRVAAIGPDLDAGTAEVVPAEGRQVLRGLWDEHVHVTQAALARSRLQLGQAGSAAEAAALVRDAARDLPAGVPLLGVGFRDGIWSDRPTRELLDTAAGERPVVLQSHDVHAAWLNSAAGRRFDVELGESGLLREAPAFAVGMTVGRLAGLQADEAVADLGRRTARSGVVGLVDFEMTWNPESWQRRIAAGFDSLRIEAAVYPDDLDRAAALVRDAAGSAHGRPAARRRLPRRGLVGPPHA
ncbi:MAG: hypothetical protein QOC59_905 [Microbacteriaceae bacterium]|nr:hypothetical protein [Microbacteriaceae bacterium]